MSPESLLRQFEVMADAPNGVRKVRELILQLAVRGKLVPQDASDEPASVLLERIAAEKQRLFKEGEISKPKPLPAVGEDETPFAVPEGWLWSRLGDVAAVLDSRRIPVKEDERLARIAGKQRSELVPYYGATQQVGWIDNFLFNEELTLLGEDGAPFFRDGKHVAYVIDGKSWVNNHAHVLRGLAGLSNHFICHVLNITDYHGFVAGTTRLKLTQGKMVKIPVPLPPLPEQRRIVAKVDELMALCDRLEARLTAVREKSTHLAASVVHHLAAA